uniref:WASH complex subunit 3 n=1 Tax=Plectus sambesii TaxID=2011161 RepID=A0A914VJ22_9BILA
MEEPDMSFVDADVVLDEIAAIDQKRLLAFVNFYITRTVRFLNNFAGSTEVKLFQLENRLGRLEGALSLLEAKMDSIPGLESIPVTQPSAERTVSQPVGQVNEAIVHRPEPQVPEVNTAGNPQKEDIEAALESGESSQPPPPAATTTNPIKTDPRYEKYFKMQKMGVLEMAIKHKMIADGVDPTLLDHPDQPAPPTAGAHSADATFVSAADSDDDDDASVATFSSSD